MENLTYLGSEIVYVSQGNFVCNARCMADEKIFVSPGIGSSMAEAEKVAKASLHTLVVHARHGTNGAKNCKSSKMSINEPKQVNKSAFNGGGNKPITDPQAKFICSLATQKEIDPDELSMLYFGKHLDTLIGSEANELINRLKRDD